MTWCFWTGDTAGWKTSLPCGGAGRISFAGCRSAAHALFVADQADRSVVMAPGGAGLRVRLCTGELEVLATSLLDETLYPTAGFGEVYGLRWGVESFYGVLKERLEVERFSGITLEAVRQDFFSSVFLANVESVLSAPSQAQLSAGDGQRKQALQVNRAQSLAALKSQAPELFGPRPRSWRGSPC